MAVFFVLRILSVVAKICDRIFCGRNFCDRIFIVGIVVVKFWVRKKIEVGIFLW